MDWGKSIKATRLRHGLKQSALAELLGLDQATVSRWERGASSPTVSVQRKVRQKLEELTGDAPALQDLFERVVSSPYRVVVSGEGSFATAAASDSAMEYFGLGDQYPDYDWSSQRPTEQQRYVYDKLVHRQRLFRDPTITHVEACVALRFPDGVVRRNSATYYPVYVDGGTARLIIRLHGKTPYQKEHGSLVVNRVTCHPEHIVIPCSDSIAHAEKIKAAAN